MGLFGVKMGEKRPQNGDFGGLNWGGHQKWPFLASKWGGGPKMGILRLQNGGQSQKIGFF